MYYLMEPLDSFFFRGSVPFEEGGETVAVESMFPPLPSVYVGAFRKFYHLNKGEAGRMQVGYNGLVLDQECLFPMPADLYWQDAEGEGGVLRPSELTARPLSNFPLDFCLSRPKENAGKDKNPRRPYLAGSILEEYLNDAGEEYPGIDLNDGYLVRTPKIGIGTDPESGTAEEHRFYQITEIRPARNKPLKLAAQIRVRERGQQWEQEEEAEYGDSGQFEVIRLGGEGKLASIRTTGQIRLPEARENDSQYFKLYLATPSIFEKGWLPGWLDRETGTGTFTYKKRRVRVKLIAAGVGRSVPCGGFGHDEEGYHPKELRFAVPAGSVYYFRLLEGSYSDAVRLFHRKCISDYREAAGFTHPNYNKYRYCDRGFGFALVGKLRKEQEERIHV